MPHSALWTSSLPDMERQTPPLPIILCIHGHGTNGAIFRLQARGIVQLLQHCFQFIFVNAPFTSLPGPGVVPVFSDCPPFLRWHCDENTLEKFDITREELQEERDAVRQLLSGHVRNDNGQGEVVGIMAFSQGTRVATGLMLDATLGLKVKLAILICGTFPALPIGPDGQSCRGQSAASTGQQYASKRLGIPSIHVQGTQDPWAAEGVRLRETYFDTEMATVVKFNGGHRVPTQSKEVAQVAASVLEAWNKCRDDLA
jgi:predicted esterase